MYSFSPYTNRGSRLCFLTPFLNERNLAAHKEGPTLPFPATRFHQRAFGVRVQEFRLLQIKLRRSLSLTWVYQHGVKANPVGHGAPGNPDEQMPRLLFCVTIEPHIVFFVDLIRCPKDPKIQGDRHEKWLPKGPKPPPKTPAQRPPPQTKRSKARFTLG